MSANPVETFLASIEQTHLLDAVRLAGLRQWADQTQADQAALVREITKRGWLTNYQMREIFNGRGRELIFGPYILLEQIGEGGMGRVYKAHHTRLGRDVALKVIRKEKLSNPTVVTRFHQEIRAAAHMSHPNVVLALDADEANGTHFFSMEFVEGTDLTKYVLANGPMPIPQACDAIRQASLGLQHAFERGLVHRDIKPSNLLLTPRGQVKLLDLGLAMLHAPNLPGGLNANRVTQEGYVLGTPDFLAPEQAQNPLAVDIRADIYGLGATLYYLLTAKVPYEGANATEKLIKHVTEPPPSLLKVQPSAPPQLDAIIQWLMAKRPEDRPQFPAQVAAAMATFCMAPPPPQPQPAPVMPVMPVMPQPQLNEFAEFAENELEIVDEPSDRSTRKPNPTARSATAGYRPKNRSSLPLFIFAGVGVIALLVVIIIVIVGVLDRNDQANRPLEEKFITKNDITMVLIQPGTFMMGSPDNEVGREENEGAHHEVQLTEAYYISSTEITRNQYVELMGSSPSVLKKSISRKISSRMPMDGVSWDMTQKYCEKLSLREQNFRSGWAFRLPTEAEWEYACRAGESGPFAFGKTITLEKHGAFILDGDDPYGVMKPDSFNREPMPLPIGLNPDDPNDEMFMDLQRKPNEYGLYDTHGNLWEWCQDFYGDRYPEETQVNPTGPASAAGNWRVLRGGSWQTTATKCRSASRRGADPASREPDIGFRVVFARIPKPKS